MQTPFSLLLSMFSLAWARAAHMLPHMLPHARESKYAANSMLFRWPHAPQPVTIASIYRAGRRVSKQSALALLMSTRHCQATRQVSPNFPYRGTGPEVWRQTNGRITHFVSSMGTTGTIMGTRRYLKELNPNVTVVGLQPSAGSSIAGEPVA